MTGINIIKSRSASGGVKLLAPTSDRHCNCDPMNLSRPLASTRIASAIAVLLSLAIFSSGCVSTKYKRAPKDTPLPLAFNLTANNPSVALTLHTVIVYKGPGSWKKEAYWDEYVVSITHRGTQPLTIESAGIVDVLNAEQNTGNDPWLLEKLSRENIKKYDHVGRKILLGVGLTAGWIAAGGVAIGAGLAGATGLAAAAATTFVLIPVWAIGSGVRALVSRHSIAAEFQRRRIDTPFTLQPGETKQGSFFFPITPGPQRLILHCRANGAVENLVLDLAPLAGLHLLKESTTPSTPAAATKP